MFCRNCGKEIGEGAVVCTGCGVPKGKGSKYCLNCGQETPELAVVCVKCGCPLTNGPVIPPGYEQKSKLAAGLLGIFLGGLGIHNFYLGYTSKAVIQIIVTVFTCGLGHIWGFIEGILILCDQITVDANNVPLKDI